jgi:membrane protein implicated in regulation of membrane protease activity
MILRIVSELGAWSWWIVGLALLCIELVAPGNVFVWFGVAAILTGSLALFADFAWQLQLILFVVLSVVLVIIGRRVFATDNTPGEQPLLNERATRIVGGVYVLHEPIVDGKGRIRVDDAHWRVRGPDLPSGAKVKVSGADGAVLIVEKSE